MSYDRNSKVVRGPTGPPCSSAPALGEEGLKNSNFFPVCCTRGRRFSFKEDKFLPRVKCFFKKKADGTDSVKSSPSARTTLGEGFTECTIFGTRERPLSRERHPQSLFPECSLREGFPEHFLALPECIWHSGKPVSPVVR
jgi:hypothetical protein